MQLISKIEGSTLLELMDKFEITMERGIRLEFTNDDGVVNEGQVYR